MHRHIAEGSRFVKINVDVFKRHRNLSRCLLLRQREGIQGDGDGLAYFVGSKIFRNTLSRIHSYAFYGVERAAHASLIAHRHIVGFRRHVIGGHKFKLRHDTPKLNVAVHILIIHFDHLTVVECIRDIVAKADVLRIGEIEFYRRAMRKHHHAVATGIERQRHLAERRIPNVLRDRLYEFIPHVINGKTQMRAHLRHIRGP